MKKRSANNSKVDLHLHSHFSDGSFAPQEIVQRANELEFTAISITDHDCIDAISIGCQLCSDYGIEFIPGIEISAKHKRYDIHILGYFIDTQNKILKEYIYLFQDERLKRAQKIIQRLNQMGIAIGLELVLQKAKFGAIGRPHIADVMVEQGYVFSYHEAFRKYLGDGCPCCVPKYKISPSEAIQLIHQAKGLSFIAHPGVDISEEGIFELIKIGIDGIETVHPRHTPPQVQLYRKIIRENKLLECGGSDCHGNRKDELALGKYVVPYEVVSDMKKRLAALR